VRFAAGFKVRGGTFVQAAEAGLALDETRPKRDECTRDMGGQALDFEGDAERFLARLCGFYTA
jgi:hypothetical protein